MLTSHYASGSVQDDSIEKQDPLLDKRKGFPLNSNWAKKAKKAEISSDENSTAELKKEATDFDVEKAVCWEKGTSVPFLFMANTLDEISKESDLSVVTQILCNMLRTVIHASSPEDLVAVVYLLSQRIMPSNLPIDYDFDFGHKEIQIAIADACMTTMYDIKREFKGHRDLGLVANRRLPMQFKHSQPEPLTAVKVFETFRRLADTHPSVVKRDLLRGLLEAATGCEPLYLIYLVQRMLHCGAQVDLEEQTLLTALGHASVYSKYSPGNDVDPPDQESLEKAAKVVKQAYSRLPDYDKIVPSLLSVGVRELLDKCTITPGIPFKAMQPEHTIGSIDEIFDKFKDKKFTCEYEYPGKRVMIHCWKIGKNHRVEVYGESGYRETVTYSGVGFEVARLIKDPVESFIIDCQIVEYDRENEKIIPSKTPGIKDQQLKENVCVFASDILYHNGEQLLQKPLKYRREVLRQLFKEKTGVLKFAHCLDSIKPEDIGNFIGECDKYSSPRLVIKKLTEDSTYEPGEISENWLNLEMGYVEYIPPSLHLVPIAAYNSWSVGDGEYSFVLACYDDKKKEYQAICDIGPERHPVTDLAKHFERLSSGVTCTIEKECYKYHKTRFPEAYTWFEPTEVWEVKAAGLFSDSRSPVEIGSVTPPIKGIGVLAPYFVGVVGEIGPDNQPTSADKVVELYKASKHTHNFCNDEE